jgi:hypothetical protein
MLYAAPDNLKLWKRARVNRRSEMKVYLFDTESGLYEGESFVDDGMLEYVEGVTAIAPPLYDTGQVPLFDPEQDEWKVMPVSLIREQLREMKG